MTCIILILQCTKTLQKGNLIATSLCGDDIISDCSCNCNSSCLSTNMKSKLAENSKQLETSLRKCARMHS